MDPTNLLGNASHAIANVLLQAEGGGESVLGATLIVMLIVFAVALIGLTIIALVWAWAFGYYFKAAGFLEEAQKIRQALEKLSPRQ